MNTLKSWWAKVPVRAQAAIIRFGKVVGAAGVAAGVNVAKTQVLGGEAIDPSAIAIAAGAAVLLAVEKYVRWVP